jgi:hypothetical protein
MYHIVPISVAFDNYGKNGIFTGAQALPGHPEYSSSGFGT